MATLFLKEPFAAAFGNEQTNKQTNKQKKVREVANRCVFSMIRVSGRLKSRLVKAADAESCVREESIIVLLGLR